MIPKLREMLHAALFVPFVIRTSDGRGYLVPTADHAALSPKGTRIFPFGDDESTTEVSALHVSAVAEDGSSAGQRPQ